MATKKKAPPSTKEVLFLEDWRDNMKGEIVSYGVATVEDLIEAGIAKLPPAEDKARVAKLKKTITNTALTSAGASTTR